MVCGRRGRCFDAATGRHLINPCRAKLNCNSCERAHCEKRFGALVFVIGSESARNAYPHQISATFVGTGCAPVGLGSVWTGCGFVVYVIAGVEVCFRDMNERTHSTHARTRARAKTQADAHLHECSNAHNTRDFTQAHTHTRACAPKHTRQKRRYTNTEHELTTNTAHTHIHVHTHNTPLARIRQTTCVISTKRC